MTWITWVVLGYVGLGAISGYRRGLMTVAFSLAGYALGVVAALHYQTTATAAIMKVLPVAQWVGHALPATTATIPGAGLKAVHLAQQLLGILVFLVIVGIVESLGRIVGQGATRFVKSLRLTGALNAVGGLAMGAAEHAALVTLVVGLLVSIPLLSHTPLAHDLRLNPVTTQMAAWYAHWGKLGSRWFL